MNESTSPWVGAAGGTVATAFMSIPMLIARAMGMRERLPPQQIVEKSMPRRSREREGATNLLGSVAHVLFGAAGGTGFALMRKAFRPTGPIIMALPYAMGIWAASYKGWIPALGLMPAAERDDPTRRRLMMASHVIYGLSLGAFTRLTEHRRRN